LGLVDAFNHPGGDATGVSLSLGALGAKRIALLRELVPNLSLIAVLVNPNNPAEANLGNEEEKAQTIGQTLEVLVCC
jgi:putative ABC transport system substrate-binding protein